MNRTGAAAVFLWMLIFSGMLYGQINGGEEKETDNPSFDTIATEDESEQGMSGIFQIIRTFDPDKLNEKWSYGLGIDSFFGSMVMMERTGEFSRSNPIPLLRKTLTGLSRNKKLRGTTLTVVFTFSRIGLRNPKIIEAYKEEYKESVRQKLRKTSSIMASILWYAYDKDIQTVLRRMANEETDPEEREEYRHMFKRHSYADIKVESMPIDACRDIELLWAEYFIFKNMTAIERIAETATEESPDLRRVILSVEASSSLAQRGGWFEEVHAYCEARRAESEGKKREIWDDILSRMKPLGDGTQRFACPVKRIALNGIEGRAIACEAMFPKKTGGQVDVLGAYYPDGGPIRLNGFSRRMLYQNKIYGGRFELLIKIHDLARKGDRAKFDKDVKQIIDLNEYQRKVFISSQPLLSEPKWRFICEYGPKLGDKSILALDLSRICMLGRLGYEAQYLSPLEVYRIAIAAAVDLQEAFDSWEEYGENFRIGRLYWHHNKVNSDDAIVAVEALLSEADSPWKKYAWDMEMK